MSDNSTNSHPPVQRETGENVPHTRDRGEFREGGHSEDSRDSQLPPDASTRPRNTAATRSGGFQSAHKNWRRNLLKPRFVHHLVAWPSCLMGPAQFIGRSPAAALHRTLVFRCWPNRPRWQWFPLLGASLIRWYLLGIWIQLFRCFKVVDSSITDTGKTRWEQVRGLLYLGLYVGARPVDYYRFRLYLYERERWLNFVFFQEQSCWHAVHSFPNGSEGAALLGDKLRFEKLARKNGLRVVQTLASFRAGDAPELEDLSRRDSVFLKPNSANQMRGCMMLDRNDSGGHRLHGYSLDGKPVDTSERDAIVATLSDAFAEEDYLVQETLCNSTELSHFCETKRLVNLRLHTARTGQGIELVCPDLEVRADDDLFHINPIDVNGRVSLHSGHSPEQPIPAYCNSDEKIPRWKETVSVVRRAHGLLPNVRTVGWDLTVTDEGTTLIEGNSCWGIHVLQQVSGTPILETPALDAWSVMDRHETGKTT